MNRSDFIEGKSKVKAPKKRNHFLTIDTFQLPDNGNLFACDMEKRNIPISKISCTATWHDPIDFYEEWTFGEEKSPDKHYETYSVIWVVGYPNPFYTLTLEEEIMDIIEKYYEKYAPK